MRCSARRRCGSVRCWSARESLVRLVGIDRAGRGAFDPVARTDDEVLLGIDQSHLGFRASVLCEPERVVVSTVVHLHNRRGRALLAHRAPSASCGRTRDAATGRGTRADGRGGRRSLTGSRSWQADFMPLVTYQALCIDANDVSAVQDFWAEHPRLSRSRSSTTATPACGAASPARTCGSTACPSPGPSSSACTSTSGPSRLNPFAGFERISKEGEFPWTTFADPEGGEFCVFTYDEPPAQKFKSLVIDSADHVAISDWWADVIGGTRESRRRLLATSKRSRACRPRGSTSCRCPSPRRSRTASTGTSTLLPRATVDDLVAAGATILTAAGETVVDRHGRPRGQRVLRLPDRVTSAVRRRVVE